ncbi:MAG: hypothetical protein E6J45_07805, partial [Chloroflexi bacterium]
MLQSSPGEAQSAAIAAFGADQEVAPPDADVAVGPRDVAETVNNTLAFFLRTGAPSGALDINKFVGAPAGSHVTDPRIIYNQQSGRFIFSVLSLSDTSCSSMVFLLISDSADPKGTWFEVAIPEQSSSNFGDQPRLGVSDNLVTVSVDAYSCADSSFVGDELVVIQKSDLIAHAIGAHSANFYNQGPFGLLPVQSIGPTTTQYVIFNDSNPGNRVGIYVLRGTPEAQNVTVAFGAQPMNTPTAVGPNGRTAAAKQNGPTTLATGDDRFLNAVWQNGHIWTAGGTNCTPSGDTVVRSCLAYLRIDADAGGSVTGDLQLPFVGVSGKYLYYPAVSVDRADNLVTVFNESSATTFESIVVAGINVAAGGTTLTSFTTLHTSATYYNYGGTTCQTLTAGCRWGDYGGAAQDPT